MPDTTRQTLHALLAAGLEPTEATLTLIDEYGFSPAAAIAAVGAVADDLEEAAELAHTVIEREAAIAAEWRA